MSRLFNPGAILAILVFVVGCGGGGGSSSLAPDNRSAEVAVFATDSFRDDYDQVWVTVHKVELADSAGSAQTVFSDDAGKVIELRALRDASGQKFELLGQGRVRPGAYSTARVTIGEFIAAVPRGADAAQDLPIANDIPRDAEGHPVINFTLASPRNLSGPGGSVVVDFDLANFVVAGGNVRPALKEAVSQLLANPERQEPNHFEGIVSGLSVSGDYASFSLQLANGLTLPVRAGPESVIFNTDGATSPELADGQSAQIEGTFNLAGRFFGTSEIGINRINRDGDQRAIVVGAPLHTEPDAGRIRVRIVRVEGFIPRTRELTIQTQEHTVYLNRFGLIITRAEFFETLLRHDYVKVRGTYNRELNLFTANHARLIKLDGEPHRVRAIGKPAEINAHERTFHLNPLYEWEGFRPVARHLRVVTTNTTRFELRSGEVVSAERFFELLPHASRVKVEGTFNRETNTITAALVKILEGDDSQPAVSAAGTPVDIDGEHGRFVIRPVLEHSGFDPPDRGVVVQVTEHTVFRGPGGDAITRARFFELLRSAAKVRVEGRYNRETNTITAALAVIVQLHAHIVAVGHPVEISVDRHTFWINPLVEWAGFEPRDGGVRVIVNAETIFKNGEGHIISAADFFHLLIGAARVRVEGTYDREINTITARVVKIRAA